MDRRRHVISNPIARIAIVAGLGTGATALKGEIVDPL